MSIEDTSKRDPLLHLMGLMSDGNDAYITSMEKAGQTQLVNSTRFPVDRRGDFEALGFAFGPPDPNDPIFCDAVLPRGWRRQAGDHDMWSYILDERGRQRVTVFYKAAFYDRSSFARIATLEGPNGRIYADHPFEVGRVYSDGARCGYKYRYNSDSTYESECGVEENFRWHHPETDCEGDTKRAW